MNRQSLFVKILVSLCILTLNAKAQTTNPNPVLRDKRPEAVDARVNKIIFDADRYLKYGELYIQDKRFTQAWENFDESVEVILMSGLNVGKIPKLNDYYLQLIERIHQIEISVKKMSVQTKETKFETSPKCLKSETKGETAAIVKDLIQAINLYKKGSDDEALSKLRLVLVSEPMSATAYLLLGKIHFRRGDIDQTKSSLKTALFWDNRLIDAHILLGKIYFEKGDILQAKNYSASALAIDSENGRAQAFSRLVGGRGNSEDKRIIEDDSTEIEKLLQELNAEANIALNNSTAEKNVSVKNYSDLVFVAPFQGEEDRDLLGRDFAYVLSEILFAPNLCSVSNEDRERLFEYFGFDVDETFTLATAIKFAIASKSSLLVVGEYNRKSNYLETKARIIRVNEGRFLSEDISDGKRRIDISLTDSESNLRILQGQIGYQLLYQYDKARRYSQNEIIERASKIKLPKSLVSGNSSYVVLDFSQTTH